MSALRGVTLRATLRWPDYAGDITRAEAQGIGRALGMSVVRGVAPLAGETRITERAKPSLSRTLKKMASYGLIRMDPGEGQKFVPKVLHGRVELDLPLLERRAAKGGR